MNLIQNKQTLPEQWLMGMDNLITAEIIPGILMEVMPGFPICNMMGICRIVRERTQEELDELRRMYPPPPDEDEETEGEPSPDEGVEPKSAWERLHMHGVLPKCGAAKAYLGANSDKGILNIFFLRHGMSACLRKKHFSEAKYLIPVPFKLPMDICADLALPANTHIKPGNYTLTRYVQGWALSVEIN
jgi:rubredoxin